jgi:hypothetical protein
MDLRFLRDESVDIGLVLGAYGGRGWRHATWSVPGGMAMEILLVFAAAGVGAERWFSQADPTRLPARYSWSARAMRLGGAMAGVSLPRPEHVPLEAPEPIAHWMAATLRGGGVPHLFTFPSAALRLCQAAIAGGIDLRGARVSATGEPVTPARVASLRAAGLEVHPVYGTAECGYIAHGCLLPDGADEVHVFHDLHAVVQSASTDGLRLPPTTLFVSSLRRTAPFVFLNLSLGDQAVLTDRPCGCSLETLGWRSRLRDIRSFEKLTTGGMTSLTADVIRALEEVLPGRFGGGPSDYQLIEEEAPDGAPRLRLLIHPRIGPVDPAVVSRAFFAAIGTGPDGHQLMGLVWRDAGLLTIDRRAPRTTTTGKTLHLHAARHGPEEFSKNARP